MTFVAQRHGWPTPPPPGSPNYYVGSQDNNGPYGAPSDALNLYKFHADFAIPPNSSFVLANTIPVASFNSILGLCGGRRACIPQPGTSRLESITGYRQRPYSVWPIAILATTNRS